MCYIDLSRNLDVNRKFTRIVGPTVAMYWALLQEILVQVKAKNKFDAETGMFKLDRKYVFSEIGIEADAQRACDKILAKLGIITAVDPNNSDKLVVDVKKYFELLLDETLIPEELVSKTSKMDPKDRKAAKTNAIKAGIVKLFSETDPVAIDAVNKLVDVYYDKGCCKYSQWDPIVKMLHACTKEPAGIAELVDYVIATNYVSIPAAIDSFMKKHAIPGTKLNTKQVKCTKLSDVVF